MQRPTIVLATIAVTYTMAGMSGCASAPKFADSSATRKPPAAAGSESATDRLSTMLFGKKKAPQKSPFEKSYADLQSDFSGTGVVSPRIGYGAPEPEPTGLKKWTSAVAGSSMVTSIKTAFAGNKGSTSTRGASKQRASFFPKKNDVATSEGSVSVFSESSIGPDIYVVMARRHETSGEWDQAAEDYRGALDVEEHHLLATTGLARLLDRQGKQDEARELFAAATKHHPQSASAWNDLGTFHAKHQRNREAIRAMNRAVSIDPQRDLYRNNMAMFLVEAGQPTQALAHLQAIHPPAIAHYSLGYLLKEQGQTAQALAYFRTAYQQDPRFEEARLAIEMLARQSTPTPRQQPTHAAVASRSAPTTTPDDIKLDYPRHQHTGHQYAGQEHTGQEHTGQEHTGQEHTAQEHTVPEDVMLKAHRPSATAGRVALHDNTTSPADDQPSGRYLAVERDAAAGVRFTTSPDDAALTRDIVSNSDTVLPEDTVLEEHTVLSEDVGTPDKTPRHVNTYEGNTYAADNHEAHSLARQLASTDDRNPARDTGAARNTDAVSASEAEDDDPLSRALRQAVEEGDASIRRSWH